MARPHVILLDPEPTSRAETRVALEGAGFEVQRIDTDPSAAVATIQAESVDCIVAVAREVGDPSVEVIDAVRAVDEDVPIVLVTDAGSQALASRGISAGVSEYVRRAAHEDPYSILTESVEQAVTQYRSQQLEQAEQERAEQYFQLAGTIMVALDDEGVIDRINDRGAAVLGYEVETLVGRDWFEVAIPDDEEANTREAFESLLAGDFDGSLAGRNEVITADGKRRTIEWQNTVYRDDAGEIIGTLSAGRDVTEQQAQAEAIAAQRDRFAALFENIPEPAIVASFEDGEPIVTRVNRAFESVFGYEAETVRGHNIDSFIVPPGDRELATDLNADLNEGKSVQTEVTRITEAGPREFRLHVVPVQPGTENVEGYAIYEDITALRERERLLESLHAAATDIVSADSRTAACERTVDAAEGVLNFDLCEISLEAGGYLVPAASSEGVDESVPAAVSVEEGLAGKTYRNGQSILVDDVSSRGDAKPQAEWRSAVSVPIGNHGIFQAVATERGVFDETDRDLAELLVSHTAETLTRLEKERALRDREETLQAQNERLERFTSVLSHDLRNPLNVATGELELARETGDEAHLETVAQAHERMAELIQDVLTLARKGKRIGETEVIDLQTLVDGCFATVDTASAELRVETDRQIRGDPGRLQSLFENLFRNAVEHGGSAVTITVGELQDGFYVADDGTGIPAETRDSVREAGFTTAETGTGLGVTIVAEAAEAHGWEMAITDAADGGARFEFTGVELLEPPPTYRDGQE